MADEPFRWLVVRSLRKTSFNARNAWSFPAVLLPFDILQGQRFEPTMPLNLLGNPRADHVRGHCVDGLDGHLWSASLQANNVSELERHGASYWTTLRFAMNPRRSTAAGAATAHSERSAGAPSGWPAQYASTGSNTTAPATAGAVTAHIAEAPLQ